MFKYFVAYNARINGMLHSCNGFIQLERKIAEQSDLELVHSELKTHLDADWVVVTNFILVREPASW